ncbi:MAG TPA: LysE family translocator [Alphaproteobacteria bacterium]|nr:LysE family translocator [Alphaproteobacteria bacterium]
MTLGSTLAFVIAVFVLGVTPGPAVAATIARGLTTGFWSAAALHLGVVLGDLVLLSLAIFGMAAVAQAMGELFFVVKIIGAAYLVWLGWTLWTSEPIDPAAPAERAVPSRQTGRNVFAGLVITLGNPKAIIFYAAFLPTFVDLRQVGAGDIAVIAAVVVIVLTITNLSYAALATRARDLLRSRRAMRTLNRTAGTMMVGAGIVVATR